MTRREMQGLLDMLLTDCRWMEDFKSLYREAEGETWPGELAKELASKFDLPPGSDARRRMRMAFYMGAACFAERVRKTIESS